MSIHWPSFSASCNGKFSTGGVGSSWRGVGGGGSCSGAMVTCLALLPAFGWLLSLCSFCVVCKSPDEGRFIGAFENVDEGGVFEKTKSLVRAEILAGGAASALLVECPLFLQPEPEKLLPVCSAAEWLASHTRPFAVNTLHECLKEHESPLLQPFELL